MKTMIVCCLMLFLTFALPAFSQSAGGQNSSSSPAHPTVQNKKKKTKPGKEMARGGGDIAKGAAKGSADLGKGLAGGVGDLATGNVGGAATSVGKGGAGFGKNVAIGTGKGTAKIGKGLGGEFKKLHRKKNKEEKE